MPVLKEKRASRKLSPASLVPEKKAQQAQENSEDQAIEKNQEQKKRPGSEKRRKTASLKIHETKIIQPPEQIPPDAEFLCYQDYTVQELIIRAHNTRYRLAICQTQTGEYLKGKQKRASKISGALRLDPQKLHSLPISSLSCDPTIALRTVTGVGNRHLIGTIEPTFGGRI